MTDSKYIDVVYSAEKKPFSDYPSKLIKELVKKYEIDLNSSILELGCGRGEFLNEFINSTLSSLIIDVRLDSFPVDKSSIINKLSIFLSRSFFARLDPIKPAPPVIIIFVILCIQSL